MFKCYKENVISQYKRCYTDGKVLNADTDTSESCSEYFCQTSLKNIFVCCLLTRNFHFGHKGNCAASQGFPRDAKVILSDRIFSSHRAVIIWVHTFSSTVSFKTLCALLYQNNAEIYSICPRSIWFVSYLQR